MSIDIKQNITNAISGFSKGNLFDNSIRLFQSLGYKTERQSRLSKSTYKGFIEDFPTAAEKINLKKALSQQWNKIELLFQLTQTEMTRQSFLFDTGKVDNAIIEAYLFFAIELSENDYTRTQLSDITRELNKVYSMPVMVLFKYDNQLTLSVIKRRLHKRDENKDVLEKVTLIKDISIETPHRAHIEILYDLSFDKLQSDFEFRNFVELHNAWQKTLDSSELNKRFYKELANWYFWAVDNVEFPDDVEKDEEKRNSTNVIRMLTRLIFVWFLKEKDNLIPDELFNKKKLDKILDYKDKTGSTFYKAILQNLFFATLNTEMNKDVPDNRTFVKRQYGIQEFYRYERFFKDKDAALKLFENIPFLNGGLFENLDKNVGETNEQRIDCFSNNRKNEERLSVPDFLFFETEKQYDKLNKIYDTTGKKYVVRGLLEILNKYKFTIHENTPIEEEIALDPELLGKVFENLLASYNEETKTTARKLTGSFYTPREVVNYMVEESLISYLKNGLTEKGSNEVDERLRDLFSYNENEPNFTEKEKGLLIEAIDACKIVDPACGSGAFPMGILHKMVFILGKLDPHNERWMQRQIDKVYDIPDTTLHDNLKAEIEKAFKENYNDYGRKLYLIENCIYGVDIQPIAVQIAKLRFFISLIVDQKVNRQVKNLGIRPLPNLETKFVAGNTLIGIERPKQMTLRNAAIDVKEKQLRDVREKHFNARTPATKKKYREQDKELRKELADLLESDGFKPETTRLMASWDPYDQNKFAGFFDSEWMFGLQNGFDVVIGNPPYVRVQSLSRQEKNYFNEHFYSATGNYDLYVLFIEKGFELMNDPAASCEVSKTNTLEQPQLI
jgi:adenine-specific DNA-methyltransferase